MEKSIFQRITSDIITQLSHFKCSPPSILPRLPLQSDAHGAFSSRALLFSLKRHQLSISFVNGSGVPSITSASPFWGPWMAGHCSVCHKRAVSPAGRKPLLAVSLCQLGSRGVPDSGLMTRLLLACLLWNLPLPPLNRNNSGQRKAPSSSKAKCNGSFFISLNISPSQGAKALKGQPEWLVADRNAIKVKKGSTSLHVIYCLFYMGAQREQARDGLSLSPQP